MPEDILDNQTMENNPAAEAAPETAIAEEATEKAAKVAVKKKSKKTAAIRQVSAGRTYVKATYNNTIVTFTDQNGNVLSWCSAGQCGFKGPKKATPYASTMIVKTAAEKVRKYGLKEVSVFVRGIGGGREAAIRALNANGFAITSIKDITPIPHNGCRAPRPRRV